LYTSNQIGSISSPCVKFLKFTNNSSNVVLESNTSLFLSITSLCSFILGNILLILFINIDALKDFPSASDEA